MRTLTDAERVKIEEVFRDCITVNPVGVGHTRKCVLDAVVLESLTTEPEKHRDGPMTGRDEIVFRVREGVDSGQEALAALMQAGFRVIPDDGKPEGNVVGAEGADYQTVRVPIQFGHGPLFN